MYLTEQRILKDYLPTPKDIERECRLIQLGWSEEERRSREVPRQHHVILEFSTSRRRDRIIFVR